MIKKLVVYGLLIFLVYQGLSYYTSYTTAMKLKTCTDMQGYESVKLNAKSQRDKLLFSTKAWRCVSQKQTFIEKIMYKLPEQWINPSREYVSPPFTADELAEVVKVVDVVVKKDLANLVNIFSSDVVSELTLKPSNFSMTDSDGEKSEREIHHKLVALKQLIGSLRDFQPDSTEVMLLKTRLAYSLDQLKMICEDGLQVYVDASKSIVAVDILLSKPKSELQLHRDELLKLKSEMNHFEHKFKGIQAREEQAAKDLIKVADEIDSLIRENQ